MPKSRTKQVRSTARELLKAFSRLRAGDAKQQPTPVLLSDMSPAQLGALHRLMTHERPDVIEAWKVYKTDRGDVCLAQTLVSSDNKNQYYAVGDKVLGKGAYSGIYPVGQVVNVYPSLAEVHNSQYDKVVRLTNTEEAQANRQKYNSSEYRHTETRDAVERIAPRFPHLGLESAKKVVRHKDGVRFKQSYTAMNRFDGVTPLSAADMLRSNPDGTANFSDMLKLTMAVLNAYQTQIEAAASVHRDIQPDNILVDMRDNKMVVNYIDLDEAKKIGEKDEDVHLGVPGYVAPELFDVKDGVVEKKEGAPITPAKDMFGLGMILMRMWQPDISAESLYRAEKEVDEGVPIDRDALNIFMQEFVCDDKNTGIEGKLNAKYLGVLGVALDDNVTMTEEQREVIEKVIFSLVDKNPDSRPSSVGSLLDMLAELQKKLEQQPEPTSNGPTGP